MLRPLLPRAVLGLLIAAPATAQTYAGSYAARNDQGGQTVVTLRQVGDSVTGSIAGPGTTFQLAGVLEDGNVVGAITGGPGGGMWFEAELDEGDLYLTLVAAGADGQPDYDQMSTLVFARQGGAVAASQGGANPLAGQAANPLAAADPWVGTFTDGSLVLQLQGGGGAYSGMLQLGGQQYPVTARGSGGSLEGAFRSAEGEFPLTMQLAGGVVTLASGGMSYTLRPATAGATANPLAGGARGAAAPAVGATPGAGGLDDGTPLGREWAQFLAGKKATQMSSYTSGTAGGYNSRTDVHLCGTGQFAIRSSSMVAVDVGDASGFNGGNSASQGTWRIITQGNLAGIELRFANGQVEQHRLDYQDNKTYVDGDRWLVTPSEACGG